MSDPSATPARRSADPLRPFHEGFAAWLRDNSGLLDEAVDAEIARRIADGDLIIATVSEHLKLITVREDQRMRKTISEALEAIDNDDIDAAADLLELHRSSFDLTLEADAPPPPRPAKPVPLRPRPPDEHDETPSGEEQEPEPDEDAPGDAPEPDSDSDQPVQPAKPRKATKKTAKKATSTKTRSRTSGNPPSTDGSDVACSKCGADVIPRDQMLSAARTQAAVGEKIVFCRPDLAAWSEEQEARERDEAGK